MKTLIYLHRYAPYTLGLAFNHHFVPLFYAWQGLAAIRAEELDGADLSALAKKEKKA